MSEYNRAEIREETFGILTDDNLALEATLVLPSEVADHEVQSVTVWVPKFPLTRSSVLTAARRSAMALGSKSSDVQLVFDLRGTGDSMGQPSDEGFKIDLHSVHEWAKERFGAQVEFNPLGFPDIGSANGLATLPLRPGVLIELYRYDPPDKQKGVVIYFSQYGNFSRKDDHLCRAVADGGFYVYGGDLLRYLLLAAPLTRDELVMDVRLLTERIGGSVYVIARALAAGPALLAATHETNIHGIIVTGPAQEGLTLTHVFTPDNPSHFILSRQIKKLAPRPSVFLWNRQEAGSYSHEGLKFLHKLTAEFGLWGAIPALDATVLINALDWLTKQGAQ